MTSERFAAAVAAFAAVHRTDPRMVATPQGDVPVSVRYHERLAAWVDRLNDAAPEPVRLAARCQHIRRWTLPRGDFEAGRTGYKRWRSTLAMQHADDAARILAEAGYEEDVAQRVRELLMKKRLRSDPDVQLLEDAVCLTFLDLDFVSFAAKHEPPKVVDIVRKTWGKMSTAGHTAAEALVAQRAAEPDAPPQLALIAQALSPAP